MRAAAIHHGVYVPSGALWGGEDIRRMAERGSLAGLTVTMRFPPTSLKLLGDLAIKNSQVTSFFLPLTPSTPAGDGRPGGALPRPRAPPLPPRT